MLNHTTLTSLCKSLGSVGISVADYTREIEKLHNEALKTIANNCAKQKERTNTSCSRVEGFDKIKSALETASKTTQASSEEIGLAFLQATRGKRVETNPIDDYCNIKWDGEIQIEENPFLKDLELKEFNF